MTGPALPDTRLPCGRSTGPLLEQVAEGRAGELDAHQRTCPHCRAALAEFDRLWAPVRAVAADRPQAPPSVVEAALLRVRGASAGPEYGRIDSPLGHTRVAARVVVALARHLAAQVPGVEVALGGLVTDGHQDAGEVVPDVEAGVTGGSTAVQITLAAAYGQDLQALGERIRAVVARGVREVTGLEPVDVTVHVDDVW
ncbi:Asp23/Gls24 family envelope stress response protein [Actinomycetospora sp. TBRC 11914]|uniref:Asp23/Gls24 family envelope stress response protein n=1 Tax=Actinomycetospora sp. TBRC 11914 TaxID=2729387 RepID=UPI00145E8895|nr:Asp23/Gls24 family envelope stress response protein [Actinomycetospora sp. TBRC 11914]NMO92641.1 Asp23/Gls24 family envelope stress response protein [Actinomycetospora sp. TBRC 11914]